jgi:hypothetical protein
MATRAMGMGRRAVLQAAAGLAASQLVPGGAAAAPAAPPGKPGDFDFLAGKWAIAHRMKKGEGWDEFAGEATCWTILGGVGGVEELRIPARGFSGMGLRLLDMEQKIWSDFWVNAKSGVLTTPGMPGSFENGVGTFTSEDVEDGKPIVARGVWDRITPTSCRWRQGVSRDGGRSWDEGWFMDWTRA